MALNPLDFLRGSQTPEDQKPADTGGANSMVMKMLGIQPEAMEKTMGAITGAHKMLLELRAGQIMIDAKLDIIDAKLDILMRHLMPGVPLPGSQNIDIPAPPSTIEQEKNDGI